METEKLTLTLDIGCAPIARCDAPEVLQGDIERALDEAIAREDIPHGRTFQTVSF
jgi:hypothetical protein